MKLIKVFFAIMLFCCLFNMPYGYYQLVRLIGLFLFSYMAYESYNKDDIGRAIIFTFLAILFQPLIRISLGRNLWNIVDVIVGVGLLFDIFTNSYKPLKKEQ